MPTIKEAIENALEWISTKNGHCDGAIYEDLAQALEDLAQEHPEALRLELTTL